MESLQKAKESLELKRSQCLDVIKAEAEANPVLKKAIVDLQSIDKALAIANSEIKKAEDSKKEKADKEKALNDAVAAVIELIDKGEIDDEEVAKIAKNKGVELADLEDAVNKYLDEE